MLPPKISGGNKIGKQKFLQRAGMVLLHRPGHATLKFKTLELRLADACIQLQPLSDPYLCRERRKSGLWFQAGIPLLSLRVKEVHQ